MDETEIKKIIGYGKASSGCKTCVEYIKHKCRGMSTICFEYKKKENNNGQ